MKGCAYVCLVVRKSTRGESLARDLSRSPVVQVGATMQGSCTLSLAFGVGSSSDGRQLQRETVCTPHPHARKRQTQTRTRHRHRHTSSGLQRGCVWCLCGVHATRHTRGPALVCRSRSLVISVVTTSMTMMASSQALYSQYDTTFANILEKASAEAPFCIEGFWDV